MRKSICKIWYHVFMTIKEFLHEQRCAFIIAKVAIIFQTLLTVSISTLLIISSNASSNLISFLQVLLVLDIFFVCTHLSYRGMYTGPKVILLQFEKRVLIYHIVSSILALFLTSYIVVLDFTVAQQFICFALTSWIVSLVTGVIFFYKKYSSFL